MNTRAISRASEELGERLDDAWLPDEVKARIAELEGDPNGFTSICHDCGIDAWAFEEDGREVTEVAPTNSLIPSPRRGRE